MREAGKPELKHFDKHIFDQALAVKTTPKKILLNTEPKSEIGQQNVWTWIHEDVENRARAEFGLEQEPLIPRIWQNYWINFTIDNYYKDLLPSAIGIGVKQLFVDKLNRSDMTDGGVSKRATLFNFTTRTSKLSGKVTDITTGRRLPQADKYDLDACHTYMLV